jgi:hypothetical protein
MQVILAELGSVAIAMLTTGHFASDFGHIPHIILFN